MIPGARSETVDKPVAVVSRRGAGINIGKEVMTSKSGTEVRTAVGEQKAVDPDVGEGCATERIEPELARAAVSRTPRRGLKEARASSISSTAR